MYGETTYYIFDIKVLFVLVVPIMSGDKLAHETISSCHICWLQRVPQSSISNLVGQGSPLHPPKHHHLLYTDSSMKGLRAHTDNLKVSVLWTPSRTIANPQLLVIHLVLDHWNLEAMFQNVSPGIQQHSPYEVHSRIYECHHGYSVKEEQVSPNIMVILP